MVQMNQKRAYEIAQSQNSSKVFERLNKMKSHQEQLKVARSSHEQNHSNKSENAKRHSSTSSSNLSHKKQHRPQALTERTILNLVSEAINTVIQKKELLATSIKSLAERRFSN